MSSWPETANHIAFQNGLLTTILLIWLISCVSYQLIRQNLLFLSQQQQITNFTIRINEAHNHAVCLFLLLFWLFPTWTIGIYTPSLLLFKQINDDKQSGRLASLRNDDLLTKLLTYVSAAFRCVRLIIMYKYIHNVTRIFKLKINAFKRNIWVFFFSQICS